MTQLKLLTQSLLCVGSTSDASVPLSPSALTGSAYGIPEGFGVNDKMQRALVWIIRGVVMFFRHLEKVSGKQEEAISTSPHPASLIEAISGIFYLVVLVTLLASSLRMDLYTKGDLVIPSPFFRGLQTQYSFFTHVLGILSPVPASWT